MKASNGYCHTQRALPAASLLGLLVIGTGVAALLYTYINILGAVVLLALPGLVLLFGSLSFGRLSVRDAGEHLEIRYGPVPAVRKRIRYAEISAVERGRISLLNRVGVGWIPGLGRIYSLAGPDCAVLTVRGRTVRVGSDDVAGLVEFLNRRIAGQEAGDPAGEEDSR